MKNIKLEWYYKEESDFKFYSANQIKELDTPSYICILKKYSLGYDKIYTIKAKG